jgi:aryl-alcohol dehydrogenase-like predicted oxidoreductase
MVKKAAALVLGCVQLGLSYGIANKAGKPTAEAALVLARRALSGGISCFDTARAYGDSEERLGAAGLKAVIVTKLDPLGALASDAPPAEAAAAAEASVAASLNALRRERLDCLLLHRAAHRTSHGGAIWARLLELRAAGRIAKLGVSVQSPQEALEALGDGDVRHIQLPFNLLDKRWQKAGVPEACRERGDVCVHVRSVFLQGLLCAGDPAIWPRVEGVEPARLVTLIASLAKDLGRESAADLSLAYARGQDFIHGVVIGMESVAQLETNLRLAAKPALSQAEIRHVDERVPPLPEQLLNPALWPRS